MTYIKTFIQRAELALSFQLHEEAISLLKMAYEQYLLVFANQSEKVQEQFRNSDFDIKLLDAINNLEMIAMKTPQITN
jgi:hypothetical protein